MVGQRSRPAANSATCVTDTDAPLSAETLDGLRNAAETVALEHWAFDTP